MRLRGSSKSGPSPFTFNSFQILLRVGIVVFASAAICAVSVPIVCGHFSGRFINSESLYIQIILVREESQAKEELQLVKGSELRDISQYLAGVIPDQEIKCPDNPTQELKHGSVVYLSKKGKMSVVEKKQVC